MVDWKPVMGQSPFIRVCHNRVSMHPMQICEFACMSESSDSQCLSNTAAGRLKTDSETAQNLKGIAACSRYGVLGFIYCVMGST